MSKETAGFKIVDAIKPLTNEDRQRFYTEAIMSKNSFLGITEVPEEYRTPEMWLKVYKDQVLYNCWEHHTPKDIQDYIIMKELEEKEITKEN